MIECASAQPTASENEREFFWAWFPGRHAGGAFALGWYGAPALGLGNGGGRIHLKCKIKNGEQRQCQLLPDLTLPSPPRRG
jgi:hypothetical protein